MKKNDVTTKILTIIITFITIFGCSKEQNEIGTKVQSLSLSSESLNLYIGEKKQLEATILPNNATYKIVSWSSSNESVATVSKDGQVTGVAAGVCTIEASCKGKKAECRVTVANSGIPVSEIRLSRTNEVLIAGSTLQIIATVIPNNAADQNVVWSSSNTGVATVDNGLITAISAGEAVITARVGNLSNTCVITVEDFYGGLCLESIDGGSINIRNIGCYTIEYKVENKAWRAENNSNIHIETKVGDRVWFRGHNETYCVWNEEHDGFYATIFNCNFGEFYVYGNIMSLVYGDDFESKTELKEGYTFVYLFGDDYTIYSHPTRELELPATTLTESCYYGMFLNCENITRAPKLPATTMADNCYRGMFSGCESLSDAPDLPATVLAEGCYSSMFTGCKSLKKFPKMDATEMAPSCCTWMMSETGIEETPELPSVNLARSCYEYMFMNCANLKKSMSILPAAELAEFCYAGMFQKCEKLETVPELPATEMAAYCYTNMFNGCKSLETAPELPATKLADGCYQKMFGECALTKAPYLPALELKDICYRQMFEGCSKLNYVNASFLTKPKAGYTEKWLDGVAGEGTFVKNSNATWDVRGVNGIPEGWTVVTHKKANI